ncbi:hypothetical protein C6A37_00670 [Desulfobacteraceae bacterium SEEP-SAG9]|nr:hypothetical protein C6A37_00670 [Desulfobacteraceae bacterium SEEP-SAG9]
MALIWQLNYIITLLFMLPYFNERKSLAVKRMMGPNNSYFSKICVTMRSIKRSWKDMEERQPWIT